MSDLMKQYNCRFIKITDRDYDDVCNVCHKTIQYDTFMHYFYPKGKSVYHIDSSCRICERCAKGYDEAFNMAEVIFSVRLL